ncbi:MAG: hypothetical protein ABI599_05880, partial [Flavobacteriales bacterium]
MRTILKTIALLTAFACAETGSAQNGWTQKADCGGGARRGAVGFSIGSKGYIGTGYAAGGGATSDFWEYDPTTDSWSQKANVNPQGIAYGVGLSIGNKGYIGSLPSWWEYDPTTNTWTQKSNFGVTQQRINAIGFSIGSKGYVGTGQEVNPNGPATSDLWEYDPLTDTWTQRADFPGGGRAAAVGFTIGAKGYVGTGSSSFADHNDLWEYDPVTDAWTQKADLSSSTRFDAVGFSIGTKGYVGTGRDAELNVTNTYNDLWEYDPALDSWVQKVDFVGGDRTAAIGFSVGQLGYVGSGLINGSISNNGPITADFWEFDPTQGCTVGAACDDGIPCTINDVVSSSCLCGGTAAADTDGDGICDLTDPCPLLPNLSNGQSCDDGDACTINDAVTNCLCAGTFQDTDNDGVCDAADPCPLLANLSPGNACNDGDACTVNDVVDAFCACNGSFVDTDDDGICNANDNCPSQPGVIGSPCDDGNACTINDVVTSTCQCQGSYLPDADGDGICDDQDDCPNTPGTIGSVCDDGNANTVNDVLSAICVCEGSPAPSDAWTQRAAFPVAGRKDAVGFSIGDFGYMGTGADDVNVFRDLWKYDPNTGSWAQMADMGGTVRSGAFAFATGGFGYVGEGMDDLGAMQQDLWMFDPVNNAWTEVSSTDPQGNGRFKAVAFSIGDLGYVGTGQTQFGATQDLWSFDPSTLSWTPLSDFGGGVRSHAVGFSIGTKGYVGTGTDGSSNFSDLWEYDPITGTWTQRTDYAGTARKTAVAFVVGTKGYITTGEDAAGEPLDLWEYDPNADSWTQRADFAGTARRGAASFAVGGRGYVCTGVSNGGYLSDLWEYAPTTSCVAGDACDDGDACTINDVRDGNCTCAGTLADSDSDGTCDANDGCPNDPDKIVPGICGCGVADTDTDGDGTADCNDSCPYLFGQNGDACGGGACMSNGVIAGCVCTAVPINQPAGDTYATSIPIVLNNAGTATVSGNNQPCYTSTYTGAQAQASADVWYSINTGACATSSMSVSLCGTGSLNDTYLHLLDGSGVSHLASNDDNGPSCAGLKSSISYAIAANTTYTIVVEGYSSNTGSYTLAVTVPGTVDTDGDGTRDCADNCPNDPNKIATGACGCGVADTDSDNDGTANCNDDCPLDPLKIAPGICGCGVADTDSDSDGTANCNDGCPSDPNKVAPGNCGCGNPEPGALCNDNDPSTTNDMITAGCVCAGTPAVCNDNQVTLTLQTDANGAQTSWEIKILGGAQVCSGSGYPNNSTIVPNCCLPNGCYQLLVYDSFGDGMTTGGYVLRNATNKRIIDNANDGVFTYTSS